MVVGDHVSMEVSIGDIMEVNLVVCLYSLQVFLVFSCLKSKSRESIDALMHAICENVQLI